MPNQLNNHFVAYVYGNVLKDGGGDNVFASGMVVPLIEKVYPHSIVRSGTCKDYSRNPGQVVQNTFYYQSINRNVNIEKSCANGSSSPKQTHIEPLKGMSGLCYAEQPYTAECLAENMEPGIIADGNLAASSINLKPDQYGKADKMVFDKSVVFGFKQRFDQAIISYKKGNTPGVKQLKTLYINVRNIGRNVKVAHRQVWW